MSKNIPQVLPHEGLVMIDPAKASCELISREFICLTFWDKDNKLSFPDREYSFSFFKKKMQWLKDINLQNVYFLPVK